jgi:hypothetical protein
MREDMEPLRRFISACITIHYNPISVELTRAAAVYPPCRPSTSRHNLTEFRQLKLLTGKITQGGTP